MPSLKPPDFLAITSCFNIQLTEANGTGKTYYFRPTTFADGNVTFGFYTDSYFNNIALSLYQYYDTVVYEQFTLQYSPPFHLSGAAWTGFQPV